MLHPTSNLQYFLSHPNMQRNQDILIDTPSTWNRNVWLLLFVLWKVYNDKCTYLQDIWKYLAVHVKNEQKSIKKIDKTLFLQAKVTVWWSPEVSQFYIL